MSATLSHDTTRAQEFFARKMAFTTGPVEVNRQIESGDNIAIIDVREEEDYRDGHLPGAVNLPQEQWQTFAGLRRDATNIVYCYSQTCHLAAKAALQFSEQGYAVMEMEGGFEAWKEKNLEIERE